jgi:hypothetical protein
MARKPALHSADDLIVPGLERALADLDPPEADQGLVSLARVLGNAVDRMSNAERAAMMGQTAPVLLRVFVELEKRHQARKGPAARPDNPVVAMRRAAAARRPG